MPGEMKDYDMANAEEGVVPTEKVEITKSTDTNRLTDAHAITAGGNLTESAPVMTPDSKYFLCGADNKVHVYSAVTGLRVHTLTGHRDTVTAIQISTENSLQAYTCSLDGDIRVWDYLDAVCLKVYFIGVPMVKMLMTAKSMSEKRSLYVVVKPSKQELKRYKKNKALEANACVQNNTAKTDTATTINNTVVDESMDIDTAGNETVNDSVMVDEGNESAMIQLGEESQDAAKAKAKRKDGKSVRKPVLRVFEVFLDARKDLANKKPKNREITHGGIRKEEVDKKLVMHLGSIKNWTFSPDGDYLAIVSKTSLFVIDLPNKHRTKFEGKARFSTVEFHPDNDIMATGDELGRITLWYSFREVLAKQKKKSYINDCVTSTLHWHAHAVSAIAFTSDGAYLISGGVEAVLVIWSLSDSSKQFLPRLGAPIRSLSVSANEEMYMVGYVTNTIHIVSASSLRILKEIRGLVLRPPAVVHRHHNYGLTNKNARDTTTSPSTTGISSSVRACIPLSLSVSPKDNSTVAFNRLPGSVQFYDVLSDKPVSTMGVVQHMYVSGTHSSHIDQPLTDVRNVAYTFKGDGLITVEGKTTEPRLKFWNWDDSAQTFTLNTVTDTAHSDEVLSVGVDPAHDIACTTSLDGTVKLWGMSRVRVLSTTPKTEGNTSQTEEIIQWAKTSTASYRGMTPYCSAFSHDGSLLAVGFDHVVTLWAPETNTLMRALMHTAGPLQPITSVAFATIPSKSLPLLIAATPDYLFVWNLLTCTVYWSYKVKVTLLTTVPRFSTNSTGNTEGYFAIVARLPGHEGSCPEVVVEFSAESPVPLRISPVPMRESVEGLAYLTGNCSNTQTAAAKKAADHGVAGANAGLRVTHTTPPALAVATTNGIIRMVGDVTSKQSKTKTAHIVKDTRIDNSDVFADAKPGVSANAYVAATGAREISGRVDSGVKPSEVVFTAPSHLVPPCTALYESFMTLLLDISRTASDTGTVDSSTNGILEHMDVDSNTTGDKQDSDNTQKNRGVEVSGTDLVNEFSYLEAVFAKNLENPTIVAAPESPLASEPPATTDTATMTTIDNTGTSKKKSSKKSKKNGRTSTEPHSTRTNAQTNGVVETAAGGPESSRPSKKTGNEMVEDAKSPKSPKKSSKKSGKSSRKEGKDVPTSTPSREITATSSAQVTPAPSRHSRKNSNKKRKAPTSV